MTVEPRNQLKSKRQLISQPASVISPSGIRKFFELVASTDDVISLGVGEPDFVTPWSACESAIRSLEKGYTMYTSNLGMPELRQKLAQKLRERYNLEYDPNSEIMITVGVSEALDLAVRATTDIGDEVIIADPSYVAYDACVTLAHGVPVAVPTAAESNFELNPDDVESRITERTKSLIIGYPANPTGTVPSREQLAKLAEVARRHRLLVISDEIYARLVYGVPHTCFASLPGIKDSTILLGGFSKSYAMTGWRVGYAAANREIIAAMIKIHQYTVMSAPTMGQVAAIESLRSGEESLASMIEEYNHRRRVIVKGLNEIGMACVEPRGAFYAFPSIKATGLDSN